MDTFKIVAVMKNRGASLSVSYSYVPHKWECGGVLYWPQSNLRALRADPASEPDKSTWKSYKCKVKKEKILGIEEAELWEEEFVNIGTDAENSVIPSTAESHQDNGPLDQLFGECNANKKQATDPIIIYTEPDLQNEILSGVSSNEGSSLGLVEKLDLVLKNQGKILDNQHRLFEHIGSEFAQARATYDRIYQLLRKKDESGSTVDAVEDKSENIYGQLFKFPLTTIEEVLRFNREICRDSNFKDYLLKRYCTIGGTGGNEEGRSVARKLRAVFFTEHVLTLFSWTGISRTAGLEKKEPFQACDGILDLFLDLVKMSDERWTQVKNEKFFKCNTLKHAKQAEKALQKKEEKMNEKVKETELFAEMIIGEAEANNHIGESELEQI